MKTKQMKKTGAKNNVLIKGRDSIAFSVFRSKNNAIIAFFRQTILEEDIVVSLNEADEYWNAAFNEDYEVAF